MEDIRGSLRGSPGSASQMDQTADPACLSQELCQGPYPSGVSPAWVLLTQEATLLSFVFPGNPPEGKMQVKHQP